MLMELPANVATVLSPQGADGVQLAFGPERGEADERHRQIIADRCADGVAHSASPLSVAGPRRCPVAASEQ